MDDLLAIAKALAHPTRLRIIEYLLEKRVVNKGDILAEIGLERAALDHHLRPLIDAGFVGILEVVIDKVKNSLCFPVSSVVLERNPEMTDDAIREVVGEAIDSEIDHAEIQSKAQSGVQSGRLGQEDAVAIVRTLFEHRGRGTKNMCSVCGRIKKMSDLALCDNCFRPVCSKCRQRIQLPSDDTTELICDRCLSQEFG
ncbi:MAG: helix-turn-helix domain-containing protein [Candidatus Thorarchaeota archaeon]|jgi:DNA-binding transcriptional ArsR family regulator